MLVSVEKVQGIKPCDWSLCEITEPEEEEEEEEEQEEEEEEEASTESWRCFPVFFNQQTQNKTKWAATGEG